MPFSPVARELLYAGVVHSLHLMIPVNGAFLAERLLCDMTDPPPPGLEPSSPSLAGLNPLYAEALAECYLALGTPKLALHLPFIQDSHRLRHHHHPSVPHLNPSSSSTLHHPLAFASSGYRPTLLRVISLIQTGQVGCYYYYILQCNCGAHLDLSLTHSPNPVRAPCRLMV